MSKKAVCEKVDSIASELTELSNRIHQHPEIGHASASPYLGINALDAVIQTFNGINAMRQHIRDGSRIHGIITDGGAQPNIVPEHAAAEFYVRSTSDSYKDSLVERLGKCAEGATPGSSLRRRNPPGASK